MAKKTLQLNDSLMKSRLVMLEFLQRRTPGTLVYIMNKSLTMEKHIQKLCQTSIAQLRNIADVRKYLTQNAAEKLIHAFITSRLDYCNSLLYGLPSSSLKKLQKVQNMAAKILTLRRKYEHITPILQELHWFPVEHRITYKILLTTHRTLNGKAP